MKKIVKSFKLDQEQIELLERYSEEMNCTQGDAVRLALDLLLTKHFVKQLSKKVGRQNATANKKSDLGDEFLLAVGGDPEGGAEGMRQHSERDPVQGASYICTESQMRLGLDH